MRKESVFNKVLFVGPQHKDHRGGIAAVLNTYSKNVSSFNFIPTYPKVKTKGKYASAGIFLLALIRINFLLLFQRRIKVVHIHSASRGSFLRKYAVFFIAKFIYKRKVIFHLHSGEFHNFYEHSGSKIKKRIEHLLSSVDCVICLSSHWQNYLSKKFKISDLRVVKNPIQRVEMEKSGDDDKKMIELLFLGNITDKKGIFDLVGALSKSDEDVKKNVRINIGGVGEEDRLMREVEAYKGHEYVTYHGWANKEKKHMLLTKSDVFVLPSYYEGLPISILEAMSYGKPIISTNVGGIPEIVKDGENGFLIEPGDKVAMVEKINYFLNNPQAISFMGNESLQIVEPYYVENVIQNLKEIYTKLLN